MSDTPESDIVGAAPSHGIPNPARGLPVVVRLPERPVLAPVDCACCGEPATQKLLASDRAGHTLLIGYCSPCALHVARGGTQKLAARLASSLLAGSLAFGLPILAPHWSVVACAALVLFGAMIPIVFLWLPRPAPEGHASRLPAAFFRAPLELICENPRFGQTLATSIGAVLKPAPRTGRHSPLEALPPLLLAIGLSPWSHGYQHPKLRILNANPRTVEVWVDDRALGPIEPSQGESPDAGLLVRIPAGKRELLAKDSSGQVLDRIRVDALPGRDHLYAPAALETCFWVESSAYGRVGSHSHRALLTGSTRFWVVPEEVSGWFAPSAAPDPNGRTSGGKTAVLRQGRCDPDPTLR